jgi:anti-sigma-K factor RskA
MTCDELRDDMELHALGLSEDPERSEIEEHLRRGCGVCTPRLKQAIALNTAMFVTAPDIQPSRNLRKRVLASVGVEQSTWSWTWAWAATTAALLIGMIWFSLEYRQQRTELADARQQIERSGVELSQVRAALSMLNQPETKQVVFGQGQPQPPRGRVFVHATQGVLILASNLPPVAPGKTYELWVIPKGGAPKPAGLFQSDAGGNAMYLSRGPVDPNTAAVAVSVEPESGSQAPTTTPIIVAPVAD